MFGAPSITTTSAQGSAMFGGLNRGMAITGSAMSTATTTPSTYNNSSYNKYTTGSHNHNNRSNYNSPYLGASSNYNSNNAKNTSFSSLSNLRNVNSGVSSTRSNRKGNNLLSSMIGGYSNDGNGNIGNGNGKGNGNGMDNFNINNSNKSNNRPHTMTQNSRGGASMVRMASLDSTGNEKHTGSQTSSVNLRRQGSTHSSLLDTFVPTKLTSESLEQHRKSIENHSKERLLNNISGIDPIPERINSATIDDDGDDDGDDDDHDDEVEDEDEDEEGDDMGEIDDGNNNNNDDNNSKHRRRKSTLVDILDGMDLTNLHQDPRMFFFRNAKVFFFWSGRGDLFCCFLSAACHMLHASI